MNFIEKLLQIIVNAAKYIGDIIYKLIEFLLLPLSYLLYFLEGCLYFINVLFQVAMKTVMIFVALFQFLFAIISGFMKTIFSMFNPQINTDGVSFPSVASQGFQTVLEIIAPTGLLTVVPVVATFFLWFYFIIKIIGLFGGQIMIKPFGNGGNGN